MIKNQILNDTIIQSSKYNNTLNSIGKNPLTYNYPYEKTRLLADSFSSQTKSILIYLLSKEHKLCSTSKLLIVFQINDMVYRKHIKNIIRKGLLDEYKILYEDIARLVYYDFLIK